MDKFKKKKENFYTYGKAVNLYEPFKLLEREFDITLNQNCYYIFRFDGKHMTQDFKIKNEPIHKEFFKTMKDTFKEFCTPDKRILFAYSYSDEISILIKTDLKNTRYRLEKLLSLYSSEISVLFYKNSLQNHLQTKKIYVFDARAIKIEREQIKDYFIARQAFAIDRYVMKLKNKYNINPQFKISTQVIKALKEKGVLYETLPLEHRYGLIYHAKKEIKSFEFVAKEALLLNFLFGDEIKKENKKGKTKKIN